MTAAGLPTGRRGQALAIGLLLVVAASVWVGGAAPVLQWYAGRGEHLAEQQALAARMQSIAATAPALQARLAQADAAAPAPRAVLDGGTDAIAGAGLQSAVQDMAIAAGATVSSAELLPAEPVGAYRRINLHVSAAGTWPVLVKLFAAVAEAAPRMLLNDVALRETLVLGRGTAQKLEATFTVIAFSAGQAPAAAAAPQ